MSAQPPTADDLADMILPVDGPYSADREIEATRTVRELVARLNHATVHADVSPYPPQLHRTVGPLRAAVHGLRQTFERLAARLDHMATDPRVEHDSGGDPRATSATAAHHLRQAAGQLHAVTGPLDEATALTHHLGYTTTRRTGQERATRQRPSSSPALPPPPGRDRQPQTPRPGRGR